MKKYIISLICLISMAAPLYPLSKKDLELKLNNLRLVSSALQDASVKMLGAPTSIMFESINDPINMDGFDAWVYTTSSLKKLMHQYNVKKNPSWNNYFRALEQVDHDLINAIRTTYDTMFSPESGTGMRAENSDAMKQLFFSITKRINKITEPVMRHKSKVANEAMICDIILQYGDQLERIASAAVYGIDFAR